MVKASIVILNWNTADDTMECIDSIIASGCRNYEIILVDSNSRADDFGKMEAYSSQKRMIRLFRLEKNEGFSGGANIGAGKARGEYLVFLNSDTIVAKGFLESLLRPFSGKDVGATCPKIYFYDKGKTDRIYHDGGNNLTYFGLVRNSSMGLKDDGSYDKEKDERMFSGTCFATPLTLFNGLGGFGPFFAFWEEADLSWRLHSKKKRIVYVPGSVVYHKCSLSVKANNMGSLENVLSVRNKYLTYYRNLRTADFVAVLPLLLLYDVMRAAKLAPRTHMKSIKNLAVGFKGFIKMSRRAARPGGGRLSFMVW